MTIAGVRTDTSLIIREADGSPTVAATELVLPNGTLTVAGSVATVANLATLAGANQFANTNTFNGTPNASFPQRVGTLQIVEGGIVQSGNGDINGTGTPRVINRFDSTQTDSDSVGWGLSYTNAAPLTSSDSVSYRDHVYVIGINAIGSQLRMDDSKPYLALQFESKFTNSTSAFFGSEWHLEHKAPGAGSPTLRALSAFLPFDLTQRGLGSFAFSCDTVLFADQLGTNRMQLNLHDNTLLMMGCRQLFDTNNVAPLQQRNAANSAYVVLPWVDNLDRIRIQSQMFAQAASTAANSNAAHTIQATAWAGNNNIVLSIAGATDSVSGGKNYFGFQSTATINGAWNNQITNTFSGGESAWDTVSTGSAGRSKTIYRNTALGGFDVGFDGVTDCFLISRAQGLGIDSLTYVTMTRASNVPANSVWTHRGSVRIGSSGTAVVSILSATATLDFGSIAAGASATLTITVTGALAGDASFLGIPSAAFVAGITYSWAVLSANTVTVRATNTTAAAIDPPSGIFRSTVIRH